jgi:hypothetical protein
MPTLPPPPKQHPRFEEEEGSTKKRKNKFFFFFGALSSLTFVFVEKKGQCFVNRLSFFLSLLWNMNQQLFRPHHLSHMRLSTVSPPVQRGLKWYLPTANTLAVLPDLASGAFTEVSPVPHTHSNHGTTASGGRGEALKTHSPSKKNKFSSKERYARSPLPICSHPSMDDDLIICMSRTEDLKLSLDEVSKVHTPLPLLMH